MLYKYGKQTHDILGFFVLSLVYFSIFWGPFLQNNYSIRACLFEETQF